MEPEADCPVAAVCTNHGTRLCPICEEARRERLRQEQDRAVFIQSRIDPERGLTVRVFAKEKN